MDKVAGKQWGFCLLKLVLESQKSKMNLVVDMPALNMNMLADMFDGGDILIFALKWCLQTVSFHGVKVCNLVESS